MAEFSRRPDLRALFAEGGVVEADYPMIRTAVVLHAVPQELVRVHPYWRLTSLLKDADGLDRVRLGDLDPRYLWHPVSRTMVDFAETLYGRTHGRVREGEAHFEEVWQVAERL